MALRHDIAASFAGSMDPVVGACASKPAFMMGMTIITTASAGRTRAS